MEKTKVYFGDVPEVNQRDVKQLRIYFNDSQGDLVEFENHFDSLRKENLEMEKIAILSRILRLSKDRREFLEQLSTEKEKEQRLELWKSVDKYDINTFYKRDIDFFCLVDELELGAL